MAEDFDTLREERSERAPEIDISLSPVKLFERCSRLGVSGDDGICQSAYDGCVRAKDPELFWKYCIKNLNQNCREGTRE